MKYYKIILLFILLCYSFQMVSAMEIQSYKITATPVNGNYMENIIELTISNNKNTSLQQGVLNIAQDAVVLSVVDSYGGLAYEVEEDTDHQNLHFSFAMPVQSGQERVLTLRTKTYNLVQKEGYFEYLLVIVPSKKTSFEHTLKLEKNVLLENTIIVPDAELIETDKNIIIQWNLELEQDVPTVFLVRFHEPVGINYWKWGFLLLMTGGMGIAVGAIGNKIHSYKRQQKALKATNILNEREKAVLEFIIKNPVAKQSEIVKQLGYTKSNMSKIIKRLEFRGLISVKKEGKIRILSLGDQMKKQL